MRNRQDGYVLVIVLVLVAALSVLGGSIALLAENEVARARSAQLWTEETADQMATRESVLFMLATQRMTVAGLTIDDRVATSADEAAMADDETGDGGELPSALPIGNEIRLDGTPYAGLGNTRFALQDERGKLHAPTDPGPALERWLTAHGRVPEDGVDTMILQDIVADFEDEDDLRRLNGAERKEYESLGLPPPDNAPLRNVLELRRLARWREVLTGVPQIRLLSDVSVGREAGLNINSAPAAVLAALPGWDRATADAVIAVRRLAPFTSPDVFLAQFPIPDERYQELVFGFPGSSGTMVVMSPAGPTTLSRWALTPIDEANGPWRITLDIPVTREESSAWRRPRTLEGTVLSEAVPD